MSQRTPLSRRNFPLLIAALVMLIGGVFSITSFRYSLTREATLLQTRFEVSANHRVRDVESAFRSTNVGRVRNIQRFFGSDGRFRRDDFAESIQERMEATHFVLAVCFLPKVAPRRRRGA